MMKKLIISLLFPLVMTLSVFPLATRTITPETIITDMVTIDNFFPRTEGSPQEDHLVAFLIERLKAGGISHREENFLKALDFHSFSRILKAEIPGERGDSLNIVVPLNTPSPDSVETNSMGIALALALLENLAGRIPLLGVRVLFMGGEFDPNPAAPLGTKQFLSSYAPEDPACFFYLNIAEPGKQILLGTGGKGVVAPRWLIERTIEGLEKNQLSPLIRGNENQYHRLGLGGEHRFIEPYLAAGYPALLLRGEGALERGEWEGWVENTLAFFTDFIGESIGGLAEEEENLYLIFQLGTRTFIIPEIAYLAILLSLSALLFLYPFFARRRFHRYFHAIRYHIRILPLIVGLVCLFLLAGSFMASTLMRIRDTPELWRINPLPFYLLKLTWTLLCLVLLMRFFKSLRAFRRNQFHSSAALLLLFVNLMLVSFINIIFSYHILWVLLCTFLLTIFRKKSLKMVCLILALGGPFVFLYRVFTLPQEELIRILLFSKFRGNFIQTLVLLPFVFLITRVSSLFQPSKERGGRIFRIFPPLILGGTCGILLLYLGFFDPYRANRPHPVEVEDVVFAREGIRSITVSSPISLPLKNLPFDGETLKIDRRERRIQIPSQRLPPAPEILLEEHPFLRRREVVLKILPGDLGWVPLEITINLDALGELVILDANFPYTMERPSGGRAKIHLGANPPLPLALSLIVPDSLFLRGRITITYRLPPEELLREGRNYLIQGRRTYLKEFSLPPVLSVEKNDT